MFSFLLFFALAGYHWENYPIMHQAYLRSDTTHKEVATCWTQPNEEGVFGNLGAKRTSAPTKYTDMQTCQSDLESQIK